METYFLLGTDGLMDRCDKYITIGNLHEDDVWI